MIDIIVMKRAVGRKIESGFALPTVIIASVVMLMVLLSGLTASSSINTAIRNQYDAKQLRLATQSGVAMMNACLATTYNQATWTAVKPLKPNTNCNGDPVSGASAYVLDTPTLKTSFEVSAVTFEYGAQRTSVVAKAEKYRSSSSSAIASTDTDTKNIVVGTQSGFWNVTFGSCSIGCSGVGDEGAHIAVVLATGEVKTLGRNNNGRLGNGLNTDAAVPVTFNIGSERGVAAFTNFLSIGRQISVITASGKVFSAGSNEAGQLGNTASGATANIFNPVQFNLPAGNTAKFVAMSNMSTFVMTDTNNIYAAGSCNNGMLGTGASCAQTATPQRVALPTPNTNPGSENTIPETKNDWVQTTNFAIDSGSAFVRMKGGAVYGWGLNTQGQLGDGTFNNTSTPKRVVGLTVKKGAVAPYTPVATQIAFSGDQFYMLDDEGLVWGTGRNEGTGELAGAAAIVRNGGNTAVCLQKDPNSTYVLTPTCSTGDGMQWMEWWPDRTWRFRTDSGLYSPTAPMICATAPATLGSTSYIQMLPCTGATNQQWDVRPDKTIRSISSGGCIEPYSNLYIVACNPSYTYQQWTVQNSPYLRPLPVPPGNPKATRISTDYGGVLIRYDNGEAWAAGSNNRGQLGNGSVGAIYDPVLTKVIIPSPRTVVDIYATENDAFGPSTGSTVASAHNNSYYILDDGSVYGAGANNFGQLGNGTVSEYVATPVKMNLPAGVSAKSVQSAYGTTVVLTTQGKVFTVGKNNNGQLGDGTTASSSTPKANQYTNLRPTLVF